MSQRRRRRRRCQKGGKPLIHPSTIVNTLSPILYKLNPVRAVKSQVKKKIKTIIKKIKLKGVGKRIKKIAKLQFGGSKRRSQRGGAFPIGVLAAPIIEKISEGLVSGLKKKL